MRRDRYQHEGCELRRWMCNVEHPRAILPERCRAGSPVTPSWTRRQPIPASQPHCRRALQPQRGGAGARAGRVGRPARLGFGWSAHVESRFVKRVLVTWCVLLGLLLQSAAWALPFERKQQTERLAHAVAHALDHGHHDHGGSEFAEPVSALTPINPGHGHDVDPALHLKGGLDGTAGGGNHGSHHLHASEGASFQGFPVSEYRAVLLIAGPAQHPVTEQQPLSAELAAWLRPPRAPA